jgi:acetate kinase
VPLAPLHQPHNLAAIRAVQEVQPELPQVACFDTAFHRTQETVAQFYGLPYEYYERGIRRYGFHGLSYEYIAATLPDRAGNRQRAGGGRPPRQRRQHVRDARGPQRRQFDGLHRARRPADGYAAGQHGPRHRPLPAAAGGDEREADRDLLYKRSGLLGLSGIGNDMRVLLASEAPRARLAIDHFVYRISRELGALAAVLGGLDALVFTAGIGENSARIRQLVCEKAHGWASTSTGSQRTGRPAHQQRRQQGLGVGGADQRGTDDRPPHAQAAGPVGSAPGRKSLQPTTW